MQNRPTSTSRITAPLVIWLFLVSHAAWALPEAPQTFTLDGQLLDPNLSTPLLDTNAKIKVQILDPSKTCILYEEEQSVNTAALNGRFNIRVGSAVGSAKRRALDSANAMARVYQNSSAIHAQAAPSQTCAGSLYTPVAGDVRYVRVIVTPTSSSPETLTPDMVLDSVPNAVVAQSLQGVEKAGFLQVNSTALLTQAKLEQFMQTLTTVPGMGVTYDGTNFQSYDPKNGGLLSSGSVTDTQISDVEWSKVTSVPPAIAAVAGLSCTNGEILKFVSGAWACGTESGVGVESDPTVSVFAKHAPGAGLVVNGSNQLVPDFGATAGKVAQGNDSRFTDSRAPNGSASGDLSGSYPNPTVAKLQGRGVSVTAPAEGQVLRYDNGTSTWVPSNFGIADLKKSNGMSQFVSASCTSAQTLIWSSITDDFSCTNISLTSSQVNFGSQTANQVFAAPNGTAGAPSFRTLVAADIPGLPWTQITSGKPTTLAGYGITDSLISNGGGTPSVSSGTAAARPAFGTAGRLYVATDTFRIYRDNGTAWDLIAQASGSSPGGAAGGDITGTYPNPTLAVSGVTAATYGSATQVPQLVVDAKGRITSATNITITGTAPGGGASGDLSGSYPGPAVAKIQGTAVSATSPTLAGQVLRYNGSTQYAAGFLSLADIRSTVTPGNTMFPATSCTSAQTLTWSSLTDTMACSNISIPASSAITGTLPVANGGTGQTTASAAFNALSPMTSLGDTLYGGASGAATRLPGNTAATKKFLTQTGDGTNSAAPTWGTISASDVSNAVINGGQTGAVTLGPSDSNALIFNTAGTARMTIASTGNVGLGTSPHASFRLDAQGGIINRSHTLVHGVNVAAPAGTQVWQSVISNVDGRYNLGYRTDDSPTMGGVTVASFVIYPDAGNNLLVLKGGNAGIGSVSPSAKLDVAGELKLGNSSSACSSTTEGQQRYNSSTKKMQFCDGTAWTDLGGSGGGGVAPPIGSIIAWHKSFANTPALPSGWLECNGQVVSDASSPYNGQTLPSLNSNTQDGSTSSGMFLRGASTSGTLQADATAVNGLSASTNALKANTLQLTSGSSDYRGAGGAIVTLSSTDPETRPANMSVVWIIRVK